ncbi:MAG: hypothetical protein MUP03_09120 [Anaerolineales bacterium]|nr:hypothetical protein [Anaerolineales bacterium]
MAEYHHLTEADRVSVLTATVLLAYALTHLIEAPSYTLAMQLPGIYLTFNLSLNTITIILAACLTASGMDWLLRSHPAFSGRRTFENWLLPTLTVFIIGVALNLIPSSPLWWLGFAAGGVLLVLVFLAEYVVLDQANPNYPFASAGLTALSFTLFLILAVVLRYASARLYLLIPALLLAAGLVCLRTIHLRLSGQWEFAWATGISLVIMQLAAGLHYWPLTPIQFGLLLLGPLYALTSLATSYGEGIPIRRALVEPSVLLGLIWGIAIWVR